MSPERNHENHLELDCVEVRGETQPTCNNTEVQPNPLYTLTGLVVKIPVVLAELRVQVPVDSIIYLPEPALEIKRIKKRLKITQCLLLQDTNTLFIKGFVRKNIEYATRRCYNFMGICGNIRHCTFDIPFKCTTPVRYNSGIAPQDPIPSSSREFEYFKRSKLHGPDFAEKDELMSGDFSEYNQISEEFYNELPFCELVASRIVEFDEFLDRRRPHLEHFPFEEKEFRRVEEKMVVSFDLKVLQTRQVYIPPTIYAVGGRVCGLTTNSGLGGVTIEFARAVGSGPVPEPVTTDPNGYWQQSGFAFGTEYAVIPRKEGFSFIPSHNRFNGPRNDLNFQAQIYAYTPYQEFYRSIKAANNRK